MRDDLILLQADYSVTLTRAKEMGGVDLILMSPPYEDARTYGAGVNWKMSDYQRLGDYVKPALKPGAHCLMVLDSPVRHHRPGYGTERGFMPWRVMLDWAERVGLRVPDRLAYGRQGQVGHFAGRFRNDWEPLLWFQSGDGGYLDSYSIAVAARAPDPPGRRKFRVAGEGKATLSITSGRAVQEGIALPGTLWWYGNGSADGESDADHPARYALPFAEDAVRCFCPPGGLVCDPFVGSGTSAVAAIRHGRRFVGGDLLARPQDGLPWIEVARRRVEGDGPVAPQAKDDGPLFAREAAK